MNAVKQHGPCFKFDWYCFYVLNLILFKTEFCLKPLLSMFFFYIWVLYMVVITKILCFIYNQISCSGLLSLALLEGLSATQLLERYLALRSQALQAILSPCQSLDNAIVKQKLSHSYTLLVHSILVIHHCFLGKSYKSNKI